MRATSGTDLKRRRLITAVSAGSSKCRSASKQRQGFVEACLKSGIELCGASRTISSMRVQIVGAQPTVLGVHVDSGVAKTLEIHRSEQPGLPLSYLGDG
jgi:hypothetical protein